MAQVPLPALCNDARHPNNLINQEYEHSAGLVIICLPLFLFAFLCTIVTFVAFLLTNDLDKCLA